MNSTSIARARMVLATIRAHGGEMNLSDLIFEIQSRPEMRTRHDKMLESRQVRRWLAALEEEGLVEREYILDAPGRPCVVKATGVYQ